MKVDRSKLRKSQTEVAPECRQLIQQLKESSTSDLVVILRDINTWYYGKCELQHWLDVMDRFDGILAAVAKPVNGSSWILTYDKLDHLEGPEIAAEKRELVNQVLKFTALMLEHSYTRQLYNSVEHLVSLLGASDLEVVLSVLGVLYVFSKRSSFIPRLPAEKRKAIQQRLMFLGETWGGTNAGFGLNFCCKDLPVQDFPPSAGDVYFEFYSQSENGSQDANAGNQTCTIHIEKLYQFSEEPGEVMEHLISSYVVPSDKQVSLFNKVRLAKHFPNHKRRLQCIQARLQAVSILLYSNASQDVVTHLLYPGFIEEVVALLEIQDPGMMDIKTAAIRTLTAVVHMEFSPRVNTIIESTGLASYHGFLPTLTRKCIQAMTEPPMEPFPLAFATGLFSFLYHLAYYEVGAEALVSCGLMESLLQVVEFPGGNEHLTFVTRAIRIMEWIANMDVSGYQNHNGLNCIVKRLEWEVKKCQPYHGGILSLNSPTDKQNPSGVGAMETSSEPGGQSSGNNSPTEVPMETEQPSLNGDCRMEVESEQVQPGPSSLDPASPGPVSKTRCLPQRAALIKAVLSFLKKSIPDPSFSDSIRNIMDSSLPTSLKYIISNVEYYGPVLFMAAIDVVTVYVFHEPSLLSSLQDGGLTGVLLKALVVKEIPATREVLSSLPSVLSALCLNTRGLQAFMKCQPFDKLFRVLLSPEYLPAMRRRRAADALGETANNLGTAMDELMRHQPTLKTEAMKAIIKLLEELCSMGRDPKYIGFKVTTKAEELSTEGGAALVSSRPPQVADEPMSDEDEDDEDRFSFTSTTSASKIAAELGSKDLTKNAEEEKRTFVPLLDYILNVVKFVEAILSTNSTDDHCREFVRLKGLEPLVSILGLPNLPLDFPSSPYCQAVSGVSKSILLLSHEPQVIRQGQLQLKEVLDRLKPLYQRSDDSAVSLLLHEVASSPRPSQAPASPQHSPLLHSISAVHAYISMFLHTCKASQSDIRSLCISHWGSELGISVLQQLSELYISLVWETIVLESLRQPDASDEERQLAKDDLDLLKSFFGSQEDISDTTSDINSTAPPPAKEETSSSKLPLKPGQVSLIKQLLHTASNLGRSLSEFFGLLVKLSISTAQRQRRAPHAAANPSLPPLPARLVTEQLCGLLNSMLTWKGPPQVPLQRLRLHFYMCSVSFVSRLLYDDRKFPYHLMLQQFVFCKAHESFFGLFELVLSQNGTVPSNEGIEHSSLPDGTEEMLDAWLMLANRLVNCKSLTESSHTLPSQSNATGFVPFKPVEFLSVSQKRAFRAVMLLWGRKLPKRYGAHIAELVLSIICHIIKGESTVQEKLKGAENKEAAATSSASPSASTSRTSTNPPAALSESNEQQRQQLIDMGFDGELAREALSSTSNLEQAMEYILSHPPAAARPARNIGLDMTEEDQMMRAIALSLGQNITASTGSQEPQEQGKLESKQSQKLPSESSKDDKSAEDSVPLDRNVLTTFTSEMLNSCLTLLTDVPETVCHVCELLAVASKRNGEEWRDKMLADLFRQISEDIQTVMKVCSPDSNDGKSLEECASQMCSAAEAPRLSSLLHLTCLLFEEMKVQCGSAVQTFGILNQLLQLLDIMCQLKLSSSDPSIPRWFSPLILLLDLYEKVALSSEKKRAHDKCTTRSWKWFDDRSGRWYSYNVNNNTSIDNAYRNGETKVRFMAGRRRYNVNFTTMVQVNEDSGNRRPIMLETVLEASKKSTTEGAAGSAQSKEAAKSSTGSAEQSKAGTSSQNKNSSNSEEPVIQKLNKRQKSLIIRCCATFICIPVPPQALHAVLKLCLRITQDHKYAVQFVEHGGPAALLRLTQKSVFPGFHSLANLVLRHVLEDEDSLKYTMEKVVRSAAMNGVSSAASGVGPNSTGSKEINYMLRSLGPAAFRNSQLFTDVARSTLRYSITPQLRRTVIEGNQTSVPPNHAQLVEAALPSKQVKSPPLCDSVKSVIHDLLCALCDANGLCGRTDGALAEKIARVCRSDSQMLGEVGRALGQVGDMINSIIGQSQQPGQTHTLSPRHHPSYTRQLTGEDAELEEMVLDSQSSSQGATTLSPSLEATRLEENDSKESEKEKKEKENTESKTGAKPLWTKSAILKLLGELVKSYGGVAQLISEYNYQPEQSGGECEFEGPAVAFILDKLLPSSQTEDAESTSFARMLLAMIASCNQAPEAQQSLVTEVKASLARTLTLPESARKHSRLQAIFGLILTMIDSGSPQPNNTMKLLVKKGLITDLARVPHKLDLCSPNFVSTMNSMLKPLERLSGVVNQQNPAPLSTQAKDSTCQRTEGSTPPTPASSQPRPSTAAGQRQSAQEVEQENQGAEQSAMDTTDERAAFEQEMPGDQPAVSTVAPWQLGVSGRGIMPMTQEEEDLEELQDMVDELLQSDIQEGGDGPGDRRAGDLVAERVISRINGTHVLNADGHSDYSHSSSDSADEDTGDEEGSRHSEGGGDETMVITFDDQGDEDDVEDDEDEDDEDGDGDEDEEDEDDADENEADEEPGEVRRGENTEGRQEERPTGAVVVMHSGADNEDEDDDDEDDEDDDDDDDGGSDMEDPADLMEEDSYRAYEDDMYPLDNGELFYESSPRSSHFFGTFVMSYQQDDDHGAAPSGMQRLSRVHGLRSERTARHHLHQSHAVQLQQGNGAEQPPPPPVIQSILGPESASDVLQLSTGGSHRTRLLLGEDIQVISRVTEDGLGDEMFLDNFGEGSGSANASTSSIPSALTRWAEEGQILDPHSIHYSVASVKPDILPLLEKCQAEVLEKAKAEEKKKKEEEAKAAAAKKEEEEKKKKEEKEKEKDTTQEEAGTSSQMESSSEGAAAGSAEKMQVEQVVESSPPSASLLVSVHSHDGDAEAAAVRSSTPVTEGVSAGTTTAITSVAENIVGAATSEAASITAADVSSQGEAAAAVAETPASSQSAQQSAATTEESPMALVEEGPGDQSQESGRNAPSEVTGSLPQPTDQTQANSQSTDAVPQQQTSNEGEQPGSSGERDPLTIDGIPIPDGVDPSFLEALPESIRREVLAEHLGLHPPPPPPSVPSSRPAEGQATGSGDLNVSPEFLAALPPDVQQEVLQQQRLEQERRRVQTNPPDQPVDPGAFIRNLAPSLRQTVLADIDDSLLPLLPPEIASEAQNLRREIEARHHRLLQERFAFGSGDTASAISALLRHSGLSRRTGGSHFARLVPSGSGRLGGFSGLGGLGLNGNRKLAGRQLLDHEALTCLLVLLFVDEPRLNTSRLHKVLRNLCYHEETRTWVVKTLISILKRTSGQNADGSCPVPTLGADLSAVSSDAAGVGSKLDEYLQQSKDSGHNGDKKGRVHPWLSVTVDASLGCRTSVFCIHRQGKVGLERISHVTIHPHASLFVCRHVLDVLLFLAKSFSTSFTPSFAKLHPPGGSKDAKSSSTQPSKPGATAGLAGEMDFWDILVKLDAAGSGRKGKSAVKPSGSVQGAEMETQTEDFGSSPMGQILTMLAHPIIQKDVGLTDKLLRLLSVVSGSLSEVPRTASKTPNASEATAESATNPPEASTRELPPVPGQDASSLVQSGSAEADVEEPVATLPITSFTPISETESVASSLVAERSSEAGGERHDVDSIDSGSADETLSHSGVTEPMVVEVSLPPEDLPRRADSDRLLLTTASASTASNLQKESEQLPQEGPSIVKEEHLGLAVNVLTSGTCSEEGLEDATTLLLQIAHVNTKTHDSVLHLLLEGARRTGELLCKDILGLLVELTEHNRITPPKDGNKDVGKGKTPVPLVMPSPPRRPVRTAPGGRLTGSTAGRRVVKPVGSDLHLPSMPSLTCKTSNQALLLRVLKVIFQLREAYRKSANRQGSGAPARRHQHGRVPDDTMVIQRLIQSSRGLGAVVQALESEAEALFQVFSQMRGGHSASREGPGSQPSSQSQSEGDAEAGSAGAGSSSQQAADPTPQPELPNLSEQLSLDNLWDALGQCLTELGKTSDSHAVLVLQPAVEAFFLVHGTDGHETPASGTEEQRGAQRLSSVSSEHFAVPASPGPLSPGLVSPNRQMSVTSVTSDLPSDTQKFLKFAETHRTVLNQILRQSTVHLADGPFAVLVDHTRVLDFDIKRRFFRQELERMDEGVRRDDLSIHVRREHVFEDSYRELHRRSADDLKCRLYVVFEGEEGQDAGGVQREWYIIMSREMFNPNYALFTTSPGDKVTYQPNASSHCNSNHLSYFKFVGRIVAKAIYDNKLLECYFTRSFYKHILDKPVHFTDLEAFDYSFYQGLLYLLEHDISEIGMELAFSTEIQEFGLSEIRDLIANGRNIAVTEENKKEYVKLVCQMKMTGAIRKQIDSFLEGFYEIIPKRLISIFNEQELELLISGLPNIDLDDLKANTEYHKYNETSLQIQWFWRALRSFDQADRAKFLQFVTGTSKVPLQGFAALEGMNGFQKFQIHRDDRSTDRLPSAHTCFNQLDLPAYETYDKLRTQLQKACDECPEGFGLA